jgi:hypothetical protein
MLFPPMCFKVLLSITNISTHAWSVESAKAVLGSSCLVFEMTPLSLDGSDMSNYLIFSWALHPELIPSEVGCANPEPVIERVPPLFL